MNEPRRVQVELAGQITQRSPAWVKVMLMVGILTALTGLGLFVYTGIQRSSDAQDAVSAADIQRMNEATDPASFAPAFLVFGAGFALVLVAVMSNLLFVKRR
jgi:hypothetical protein